MPEVTKELRMETIVTKRLYILPYNHRELFGKHLKNGKKEAFGPVRQRLRKGLKMAQNTIKEKGVLAPEDVLEVEPFFLMN